LSFYKTSYLGDTYRTFSPKIQPVNLLKGKALDLLVQSTLNQAPFSNDNNLPFYKTSYFGATYRTFSPKNQPVNLLKGKALDLLVQSTLNRLLLVMITIYLFTKQAILVLHIGLFHPRFSQSIYCALSLSFSFSLSLLLSFFPSFPLFSLSLFSLFSYFLILSSFMF
jgi:hypothetical protein